MGGMDTFQGGEKTSRGKRRVKPNLPGREGKVDNESKEGKGAKA